MLLINIIKRAIFVIREAWLAPRAKRNRLINRNFFFEARDRLNNKRGVKNYLKNHSAISKLKVTKRWHYNKNKSEFQLNYKSSIFGNGVIRIKKNHSKKVLIFLHGYYSSSENVLSKKNDPQNISNYCFKENIDLAAWTFPLHGQRGENSIYLNLKSNVTNEREYSRFLGMYNSSIWLEYLNEIEFCINEIKKYYKNKVEVYIVGWSMGAAFVPYVQYLFPEIKKSFMIGSFARFVDLINDGKTRLHGYFFYPNDSLKYFDLEDILIDLKKKKSIIKIIFGEGDPGCLKSTRKFFDKNNIINKSDIIMLKSTGHFFTHEMKDIIFKEISYK
tara:strand:- start:290 stop:1282 length:993 start_codon:yes stop_codon:yes gene_type:complete